MSSFSFAHSLHVGEPVSIRHSRRMLNDLLIRATCRYRPRAFLVLPMCFNIGVIIGPIFGGLLADPVGNYPDIFGPGSVVGGDDGVWWMKHWPYALPNVLSGIFIIAAGIAVTLGLDEVSFKHLQYHWHIYSILT